MPALKTRIEKLQNYKRDQIEKAGDVMTGLDISLKDFAIILSGSIIVWILFNTLIQS